MPVPGAWISRARVASWAAPAGVMLVAAVSPFERPLPVAIGGFTLTTLELVVMVALTAGAVGWLLGRVGAGRVGRPPAPAQWRTPITLPIAAVLAVVLAAALAAPEFRGNALRFWGRLVAAAGLFLLTLNGVTTRHLAHRLIATLLAAGSIVGALAVLELAQVAWVMDWLRVFRPGFHVVGGQVRATSTLFYPTIASMYLEVVFALGLCWLVAAGESATRRMVWPFAALVLVGAGIAATFTRAGLITVTLSLAVVGGSHFLRHRRWTVGLTRLAALAGVLLILVLVSRSPQMLVSRLSTEGSQDWYGAAYRVPPALTLRPGSFNDVPVTLSNRGLISWQSSNPPTFALSYHWLASDSDEVVIYDGLRTPFAQPVAPGDDTAMVARVRAPGYPGLYTLVWDVVHEHRTWLSIEGVYPGRTVVTVEGAAVSAPLATHGPMPSSVMRLPRRLLWTTALSVTRDYPLLGIGPDNFRHIYGRYLKLVAWDTRVHANNSYLEVLAGTGIAGLAAVAWLMAAAFRAAWRGWLVANADDLPLYAAVVAACLAITVHGLVDSFFSFTPTYVVFALTAGLMFSPAVLKSESTAALVRPVYANRV